MQTTIRIAELEPTRRPLSRDHHTDGATTMSSAKYIGRIGALAVTLGVGFAVTVAPGNASAESAIPPPDPPRTALIMGGTTIPKPDDYLVKLFMNQFIVPTHPNETIDPPVAGNDAPGVVARHGIRTPHWARGRSPERLGTGWRRMAERAVVETLWAVRRHNRSVASGRGSRPRGRDGREPRCPAGDLRRLAGRGRRGYGETQARRAIPG